MSKFSVQLFGSPAVHFAGKKQNISRKLVRQLLFYILVESGGDPNRLIPRQSLVQTLWTDAPHGNDSLRKHLSHLRKNLRTISATEIDPIPSQPGYLTLNTCLFEEVDIWKWQELYEKASQAIQKADITLETETLICEALEIWAGQPDFLEGTPDSPPEWADWRDNIRKRYTARLRELITALLKIIRLSDPNPDNPHFKLLKKGVHNFLDEQEIQKAYLQALLASNRPDLARNHCRELLDYYQKDGDSLPPAIVELMGKDCNQAETHTAYAQSSGDCQYFVGRKTELSILQDTYERGGVITLQGESGIGKSCLIETFSRRFIDPVEKNNPQFAKAVITCNRLGQAIPLQPFIDFFHDEADQASPQVNRLRKKIRQRIQDTKDSNDILRLILSHIRRESSAIHLVLVVKNIQWADEVTLNLLELLRDSAIFSQPKHLLIMTYTPGTQGLHTQNNPALYALLRESKQHKILQIPYLTLNEIALLAERRTGIHFRPDSLQKLEDATNGNPYYLQSVLDEFARRGIAEDEDWDKSLNVNAYLRNKLAGLTPEQQDIAYLIMALERPAHINLLQAIVDSASLDHDLDRLQEASIVRVQDNNTYSLVNQYAARNLFQDLYAGQQRDYHARIATGIEKLYGDKESESAYLAYHWEKAGKPQKAFQYWLAAARYAFDFNSAQQALDALTKAEDLVFTSPVPFDTGDIYRLYALYNEIAFGNDNPLFLKRAADNLQKLCQHGCQGEELLLGTAHNLLANYYMAINQFAQGEPHTHKAIDLLSPSQHPFELSTAYMRQGVFAYMQNRFKEALPELEKTLEICQLHHDAAHQMEIKRNEIAAHYELAFVKGFMGQIKEALTHAQTGFEQARQIDWNYGKVVHYSALSGLHYLLGDFQSALDKAQRGLELTKKINIPRMEGYLYGYASMASLALGEIASAWKYAEACMKAGEQHDHAEIISFSWRNKGDIHRLLNNYPAAEKAYQQGYRLSPNSFLGQNNALLVHLTHILAGQDLEANYRALQNGIEQMRAAGIVSVTIPLQLSTLLALTHYQSDLAAAHQEKIAHCAYHDFASLIALYQNLNAAKETWKNGQTQQAMAIAEKIIQIPNTWVRLYGLNLLSRLVPRPDLYTPEIEKALLNLKISPEASDELLESWQIYRNKIKSEYILL